MRALSLGYADLAELSAGILGQGGAFRFQARGASMAPFIRHGDLLTVQPVDKAALDVGDVILYRTGEGQLAAHRVTGRSVAGDLVVLLARGDAATGPAEELLAGQVLGRVVQVQRGDRFLDLDRGARRAAARLWVATAPLGLLLLRGGGVFLRPVGMAKRLGHWLLRWLQGMAIE
jgi:hypothetical protein